MNNSRLLALLFTALLTTATAQDNSEFAALRTKAEKGNGIAQYNLGLTYAEGRNVPADPIAAYVWLSLARENGARGRALDTLIASLDRAALLTAQQRLADLRATLPSVAPKALPSPALPESVSPAPIPEPSKNPTETTTPESATGDQPAIAAELAATQKTLKSLQTELAQVKSRAFVETQRLQQERDALRNAQIAPTLASQAALEAARVSESRTSELTRQLVANTTELEATRIQLAEMTSSNNQLATALASVQNQAIALEDKTRALQVAQTELENLAKFTRQIELTLAHSTDEKTSLTRQLIEARAAQGATHAQSAALASLKSRLEATLTQAQQQATTWEAEKHLLTHKLAAAENATPAYPNLTDKVLSLEAQLTAASQGAQASTTELAAAQARSANLSSTLATTQAHNEKLLAEKTTLNAAVAETRTQLEQENTKLATALKAVETTRAQLADFEKANVQLGHEKSQLGSTLADDRAQLKRERDELTTRITDLASEVAQLRSDRERMQKLLAETGKKLRDADAASARIKDLESQTSELKTQIAASASTTNRLSQLESALAESRAQTETSHAAHVAEIDTLKAQLANRTVARAPAPTYPDLSDRVRELTTQLAATTAALESARQPVAPPYPNLTDRVRELETQTGELQSALAAAQKTTADHPHLTNKIRELETRLSEASRQLTASTQLQAESQTQLATVTAALAQAKATDNRAELQRSREELTSRVTDLASEVAQLRGERERMLKLLAETGKKLRDTDAAHVRIKELETQSAALKASLSASEAQANGLTNERDTARAAQNDLRDTVTKLQEQKALAVTAASPAYPDLTDRVRELETQLASRPVPAANVTSYPDLSDRVHELETRLANTQKDLAETRAAQSQPPATIAPTSDPTELQKRLADTEDRLATALRSYSLLENDRTALEARAGESTATLTADKIALASRLSEIEARAAAAQTETARLNESLSALQRSTAQSNSELAAAKALLQQMQGSNTVLATENYQLKTRLARSTGTPVPAVVTPVTPTAPTSKVHVVVASDSLSKLSQTYYGHANRWQEIYQANREKIGPTGVLRVGTELRIP